MASKFSDFLKEKKIDPRRIISASAKIEKLRPEDRAAKLAKRQAKAKAAAGGESGDKAGTAPAKPRSGRPVTQRAIDTAMAGKPLSGPQKTRMLRAVNALLELKKGSPVELSALF